MREVNLFNLTPHTVNVMDQEGNVVFSVDPSGTVARCKATTVETEKVLFCGHELSLTKTQMGEVQDLPEGENPDTIFIVSRVVADAAKRGDLRVPDQAVRNDKGQVIGCMSLSTVL